ncbi:unnamed protein product [Ambrosiozyma monospora]|uniref:Unnamed protein product n=1 Tax=Ambrosiozyma monospora TaxID=43982 RepID=A0ACB5T5Q2_AMBMO|nr:unnamed protein product [Ambrosiozyma monospora]
MGGKVIANVEGIEMSQNAKFLEFSEVYYLDPDQAEKARLQNLLKPFKRYRSGKVLATVIISNKAFFTSEIPSNLSLGEFGWDTHIPLVKPNRKSGRVSMKQYFRYICQERPGIWNPIHHCGSIAQEFYATAGMMLEENQHHSVEYHRGLASG